MTRKELHERIDRGERLCVGEYRLFNPGTARWRDKDNGARRTGAVSRHSLEFGNTSVDITVFAPDGATEENLKAPFEKGQKVVLHIDSWISEKGSVSARGSLEPLEESPSVSSPVVASRVGKP